MGSRLTHAPLSLRMPRWKAKEDRLRGQRDVSTLLKPQKRWLFLIKGVWAKVLLIWSIFGHSIGEAEGGLTDCPTSLPTSVRLSARTKYTRMHARVR